MTLGPTTRPLSKGNESRSSMKPTGNLIDVADVVPPATESVKLPFKAPSRPLTTPSFYAVQSPLEEPITPGVTASCAGAGFLAYGNDLGQISLYSVSEPWISRVHVKWNGFSGPDGRVWALRILERESSISFGPGGTPASASAMTHSLLCALGQDEDQQYLMLKIWQLPEETLPNANGFVQRDQVLPVPTLLHSLVLIERNRFPVTAFDVVRGRFSFGLENGVVYLGNGSFRRGKFKTRIFFEGSEMIQDIIFTDPWHIFIATMDKIFSCAFQKTSLYKDYAQTISENGVVSGCICKFASAKNDGAAVPASVLIASDQTISSLDSKGNVKILLSISEAEFGTVCRVSYTPTGSILILCSTAGINSSVIPTTIQNGSSQLGSEIISSDYLLIYDLACKLFVFAGGLPDTINHDGLGAVSTRPYISSILYQDGKLFCNHESQIVPLHELDLRFKVKALIDRNMFDVAEKLAADTPDILARIHQAHGDYLFQKTMYEAALLQYFKSIGNGISSSGTICKFLDVGQISLLAKYLLELFSRKCAKPEHTFLLLNCLTTLQQDDILQDFIHQLRSSVSDDEGLEDIFYICKNAGYFELAMVIAKNIHSRSLQLEALVSMKDYSEALHMLSQMIDIPTRQEEYIEKYGALFMEHCPERMTAILIEKCQSDISPSSQFHLFVNQDTRWFCHFLESFWIGKERNIYAHSQAICHALVRVYLILLDEWKHSSLIQSAPVARESSASSIIQSYDAAKVEQRLLGILCNNSHLYNSSHVFLLCKTFDFLQGQLIIEERESRYAEFAESLVKLGRSQELVDCCVRYAESQPRLWVIALAFFNRHRETASFEAILAKMRESLMPHQVLNLLRSLPDLDISFVVEYCEKFLGQQEADLGDLRLGIEELKHKVDQLNASICEFENAPYTLIQASKCNQCTQALYLPCVHFLCQHSYHSQCLMGSECPKCESLGGQTRASVD